MKPISRDDANRIVRRLHYSGKVVNNSQVHLGVFLAGVCHGCMQFGPSLDKRKLIGLVRGTRWNEFIELNRLAFADELPRNSESRALGVAFRMMRKAYPHLKWVVSFADAAQCGDGTIYRASGFLLTGLRRNTSLWANLHGDVSDDITVKKQAVQVVSRTTCTKGSHTNRTKGRASMSAYRDAGYRPIPGFQMRYIYFLHPKERENLTVPVLPFSAIADAGAGMYRGKRRATSIASDAAATQADQGGATPTVALSSPLSGKRDG